MKITGLHSGHKEALILSWEDNIHINVFFTFYAKLETPLGDIVPFSPPPPPPPLPPPPTPHHPRTPRPGTSRAQDQPGPDRTKSDNATNLWGFRSPGRPNEPALGRLEPQAYPLLGNEAEDKYEYKAAEKAEYKYEYNRRIQIRTLLSIYHVGIERGLFDESSICKISSGLNILDKELLLKELEKNSEIIKERNP